MLVEILQIRIHSIPNLSPVGLSQTYLFHGWQLLLHNASSSGLVIRGNARHLKDFHTNLPLISDGNWDLFQITDVSRIANNVSIGENLLFRLSADEAGLKSKVKISELKILLAHAHRGTTCYFVRKGLELRIYQWVGSISGSQGERFNDVCYFDLICRGVFLWENVHVGILWLLALLQTYGPDLLSDNFASIILNVVLDDDCFNGSLG